VVGNLSANNANEEIVEGFKALNHSFVKALGPSKAYTLAQLKECHGRFFVFISSSCSGNKDSFDKV